jgi:2-polyprenyl-6-methoxyphenol hydroxylase-like FAD-dependent oxidoreductase
MGACSAIEDAAQMVEQLTSDKPLDQAIDAYVDQRRAKTREIEKGGRRRERMMMTANPVISRVRDWVLKRTPEDRLRQVAREMATGE